MPPFLTEIDVVFVGVLIEGQQTGWQAGRAGGHGLS